MTCFEPSVPRHTTQDPPSDDTAGMLNRAVPALPCAGSATFTPHKKYHLTCWQLEYYPMSFSAVLTLATICFGWVSAVHSLTNYANVFIDPSYVLSSNFSATTLPARRTIVQWADASIAGSPWSECADVLGSPPILTHCCARRHH